MDGAGAPVTFRTRTPRSTPASSLANDLKIPLTCSEKKRKKKGEAGEASARKTDNLKSPAGRVCVREGEVTEMYGHILKIHFCISDNICLQQHKGDFIRRHQL